MNKWFRLFMLVLLVAGISWVIANRQSIDTYQLENFIRDTGVIAPLVFMLVYIIGTVVFFPGSVLTLAGGAMFGPVWGTFYNLTSATIGAALSFITARYLASDWVEKKSAGRIQQLKQGVEAEGWRFVAFVRLVPLFPFNLLNYALGLTKIKLSHYTIASYIFMLPGAIAYTYVGYALKQGITGSEDIAKNITIALTLLGLVAFLPNLVARLRRGEMLEVSELAQRISEGEQTLILDVRDEREFSGEHGHIEGALNIPLSKLKNRVGELEHNEKNFIAIVCRTDKRSVKAANLLGKHGFADVHVVKQGMVAWNENNYAIER